MKTISLTRGLVAVVDDSDFEKIGGCKWFAEKTRSGFYASRNVKKEKGRRLERMHQVLLGISGRSTEGHHKNGDGLNNTRENLLAGTRMQNAQGFRNKGRKTTSRFRGLTWDSERSKWQASLVVNKKKIHLGRFVSEEEAARAYDSAAMRHFGDFACPNFPHEQHV